MSSLYDYIKMCQSYNYCEDCPLGSTYYCQTFKNDKNALTDMYAIDMENIVDNWKQKVRGMSEEEAERNFERIKLIADITTNIPNLI